MTNNSKPVILTKEGEQIFPLTDASLVTGLADVATSGDYDDLLNKPTIPPGVVVDQTYDPTSQNAQSGVAMAGALEGKQDTIADLPNIRAGAAAGATALQSETDPTVPAWAKAQSKPTYNYSEIQGTPDLSQFVTKSVNDLTNYYLKSETYTKAEVQSLISAIQQFTYEVVSTLPTATADTMHKIYLVPSADPQQQNVKDEYITIESSGSYSWEQIGSTAVDLSGYVTTTALNTALSAYTTTANLMTLLAGKQDALTFDSTPTANSTNPVTSGGVKSYVDGAIPTVPTISTDIQTDKASTTKTAAPSAVYSEVHPAFGSSQPAGGLLPNVLYKLGTLTGNVTISFAAASDATIENEYKFTFTAGSTAPTITWPAAITGWAGNCVEDGAPVITGGNYYLVSVEDGIALIAEVEA